MAHQMLTFMVPIFLPTILYSAVHRSTYVVLYILVCKDLYIGIWLHQMVNSLIIECI